MDEQTSPRTCSEPTALQDGLDVLAVLRVAGVNRWSGS